MAHRLRLRSPGRRDEIQMNESSILIVERLLALPFLLLGLSHIVQRQMWLDVFADLASKGHVGVVWRSFLFELWPAVLIVCFHQDWTWPGIILTVYGHLLMLKVAISLLVPDVGLKSLRQAERVGGRAFVGAGLVLVSLGVFCGFRAFFG